MKIALINPKGAIFGNNPELASFLKESVTMGSFRHFWSAPNLGLLTIAAYFPDGWELCYIDENYRTIDFSVHYDMVCLSAMTVQADRAYEISARFRAAGVLTVVGGIHATILPEEAAEHADVVLAGEGEPVFAGFLDDFLHGCLRRIYRPEPGRWYGFADARCPRYDLVQDYAYPVINLFTTRGCPRSCNFCCASNVYGKAYRRKPNRLIMQEIDQIQSLYPDRLILFADDNFFVRRTECMELMEQMEGRDIRFIAQADISIADDPALLQAMSRAGCQWIVVGFESVSSRSLAEIESGQFKQRYLEHYKEKIAQINRRGIRVYGTFIVGLDHDGPDVFEKTADFILEHALYGANITVPTPLPGTALRKRLEAQNRILSSRWSDYTLWDVVIKPEQMTPKQLQDGLLAAYRTITEPGNAGRRLKNMLGQIRSGRKKRRTQDGT